MHMQMWKTMRGFALPGALLLMVGCGGTEVDPADPAGAVAGEEPTLGQSQSALVTCAGGGNVATVTNAIAANCGGIAGCSFTETSPAHNDIRLSGSGYCACYEWLWSKRNTFPYNSVQIIYHNAATGQCGANYHIHVQKKNGGACNNGMGGLWHMDLDTSPAESPSLCVDNDTRIDRTYNSTCGAIENKQSGACVNPGGGGGTGPQCSANCGGGGWWCTGDGSCIVNGVAGHNYHCPGNNTTPDIDQACANGCTIAASGYPDYCRATNFCGGGAWCGNDCVNGYAKTLYNFSSGGSVNSVTHCQVGYTNKTCVTAPAGYNDYCN